MYRRSFEPYAAGPGRQYAEGDPRAEHAPAVKSSAQYSSDHGGGVEPMPMPIEDGPA